ncbi:primary-amine oxidase [Agromyces marinus]|uniref:Amine oxidase n=1 Tax=Agromyces marinus TaxID=1389020 RepID=A0ABN6Y933_9MICO|nr:primary-amine oxidase [Agromyces marinus]UIP57944.1 Histamine oxidase [Agromyces marinus]BDZ53857.1 amine oxidase [Agromyces marinus]
MTMTSTTRAAERRPSSVSGAPETDPMRGLSADEIDATREILAEAGVLTEQTRFVYVGLDEPAKSDVLSGAELPRVVRVLLLDRATGASADVRVSVTDRAILSRTDIDGANGHVPILDVEFEAIYDLLGAEPEWHEALAKRGITHEQVALAPLSAGEYGFEAERGRRVIRVLAFMRHDEQDHCWAHPVDGLCAYVDMIEGRMFELVDHKVYEIPAESGNFDDPEVQGAPLDTLKPISITQPEGPSFTVEEDRVSWANWRFSLAFDAREGLVLRRIRYVDADQGGVERDVVYRASIAEMVVPYGDPSPARFWQNYFDTGEYVFGRYANSLQLGCDCLGEIRYFDATIADEFGHPRVIPNAICMHEEDYGTLWKHTDIYTGSNEVRRQRRLVVSFFTTVGNYDYGFYWYLYLDGTIECEAKLTGVLFSSAYDPEAGDHASEVAPGLGAPYHQHLFSARLDMMVDGVANAVDEVDAVRLPMGEGNAYGNAFTKRTTRLRTEAEGARDADPVSGRVWHIVNTEQQNRLGRPVGYELRAEGSPTLLADPESVIAKRAGFTRKHLWVTRYDRDERYPAGDLVNQNPGGDGLPRYTEADRSIDGEDIVLWHTFGPTHFPRVEDWPVMPVDYAKFTLKPYGFFGRNPTLNVPSSEAMGMACHTDAAAGGCRCEAGACTCSGHGHGHGD